MKIFLLSFLSVFFSLSASAGKPAGPDEAPAFDVACKIGEAAFSLHFQSKSGELTEDDMAVTLRQGGKEIALPLKRGWYKLSGFIRDTKKLPRVCRAANAQSYDYDYPAIQAGPTLVLLFFRIDGRPGFSQDSLVLYDTKEQKVLDVKESVASLKERNTAFRVGKDGVEQRLVRDWLQNTGCDCAETAIEEWNPIRVKDGKIALGWVANRF
jgi:hypothetical protein